MKTSRFKSAGIGTGCETQKVIRFEPDTKTFPEWFAGYDSWPTGGCSLLEACDRIRGQRASLFDQLASGNLTATGSSVSKIQQLDKNVWQQGISVDWERSELRPEGELPVAVRVHPLLKAPHTTVLFDNSPLEKVFSRGVLNDPEMSAFAAEAITLAPDLARIFVGGSCFRLIDARWPVRFERWEIIDVTHPDQAKRSVFDAHDRPDSIQAIYAASAFLDRYMALIEMLRRSEMTVQALNVALNSIEEIPSSIWQHEDFQLSPNGDIYRFHREATEPGPSQLRVWTGSVLKRTGQRRDHEVVFHMNTAEQVKAPSGSTESSSPHSVARVTTTSTAKRACFDWLKAMMLASPKKKTRTKSELRNQALQRWDAKLSRRAFDREWEKAIEATDARAWSFAGAPPKTSRHNHRDD